MAPCLKENGIHCFQEVFVNVHVCVQAFVRNKHDKLPRNDELEVPQNLTDTEAEFSFIIQVLIGHSCIE